MASSKSIWKGQIPINCQLCETEKVIKWKCIQCSLLMCNNCCDKIHPKFRNAKEHKIINIKDLRAHQEELDFTNINCEVHSRQSSCLFCRACDILVCPTCVSKVHKKHDLIEIWETYQLKMEKLKEGQSEIQKDKKNIVMKKDFLDKLIVAENSKHSQVRQDILTHGKALHKAVDQHIEKLVTDLDRTKKNILQSIEQDLDTINSSINEVDYKNGEIEDFRNTRNTTKFFQEVKKLEKSIEVQTPITKVGYLSVPIFNPGEITQFNVGVLQNDEIQSAELGVAIVINKRYQTNLSSVEYICSDPDTTLWIWSWTDKVLQKVKPAGNKINIISSRSATVNGMAVTQSNNLLISTDGMKLKQINSNTGALTDSVYNVSPFLPTGVHITSDNKVLVAGRNKDRKVVILMNQNGDHERVYEHDQHKQPIFTNFWGATSTRNGNIHVLDEVSAERHRVVVLGQGGDIINIYTGDKEINKDIPFTPTDIVTTPRDNVIVADPGTSTLHILNNAGLLMTCNKTSHINIISPWSLALTPTGQLYIGCLSSEGNTTKNAKIYDVTISGC
ncbi:uncharacterized protein LOC143073393 [Mytilus galloprovincialis]|uniref:uncharacterized protein LOC143073393 n=1 Tax=Mytilus galloprovincialis TaxID=29158 RepID=UPI003F7BD7DD